MKGGLLQIEGNAGDHVGSAYRGSWRGMTGGEIRIDGNARSQLGGGLAGGQIVVAGNVENFCGIRQSGGLIAGKGICCARYRGGDEWRDYRRLRRDQTVFPRFCRGRPGRKSKAGRRAARGMVC